MNKATPAPESAEPLKFKNAALLNRLFEMTKAPYYATACDTLVLAEMAIVGLERENAALRAEVERLAAQAGTQAVMPAPSYPKETIDLLVHDITGRDEAADAIEDLKHARYMLAGKTILDVLNEAHDAAQPPAQAEPAPAPVGEYPPLPKPARQGPWPGDPAYFIGRQMHAYLDADRARRPDREVRLLTVDEVWHFALATADKVSPDESDEYPKVFAEVIQRAAFKANGLTIKEQS